LYQAKLEQFPEKRADPGVIGASLYRRYPSSDAHAQAARRLVDERRKPPDMSAPTAQRRVGACKPATSRELSATSRAVFRNELCGVSAEHRALEVDRIISRNTNRTDLLTQVVLSVPL
jgi:hypothetical protein